MTRVQAIDHLRGMGHSLEDAKVLAEQFMDFTNKPEVKEKVDLLLTDWLIFEGEQDGQKST